jgi:hypothetical protein
VSIRAHSWRAIAAGRSSPRRECPGERSEQQNNAVRAVVNFEQAEASFARAEAMQPGNEEAKEGQQQVQAALARLRQQMAQKAGQQPGKPQTPQEAKQSQETFQSMLARLKDELKTPATAAARDTTKNATAICGTGSQECR